MNTNDKSASTLEGIAGRLAELPPEVLQPVAQAVTALLDAIDEIRGK